MNTPLNERQIFKNTEEFEKTMHKRGQVTVFIILGLFLLFVIIGITYIQNDNLITTVETKEKVPLVTQPILEYIDACLERSIMESTLIVLLSGGDSNFSKSNGKESWVYDGIKRDISLYFDGTKSEIPDILIIEQQIGKLAEEKFSSCINNFSAFVQEGYIFNYEIPNIEIHFLEKRTKVSMDFPVEISKNSQKKYLKSFTMMLDWSVLKEYTLIKQYLVAQEQEKEYLLLGELSSKLSEENVILKFKQEGEYGEKVLVSAILPIMLLEKELRYNFALRFRWDKEINTVVKLQQFNEQNEIFRLHKIDSWMITTEGIFTHKISAEGSNLSYKVDPNDILIDAKGVLTLNTNDFFNGEYVYYIRVTDGENMTRVEPLYLFINVQREGYPLIAEIQKQYAKVGKQYTFKVPLVNIKNESVMFESDSNLFLIDNSTGLISFVPDKEERGYHSVRVDVSNKKGRTWKRWEMVIS